MSLAINNLQKCAWLYLLMHMFSLSGLQAFYSYSKYITAETRLCSSANSHLWLNTSVGKKPKLIPKK